MLQWVAATAVLGESGVAVIGVTVVVQHHVFDDGTIANRIPDNGFVLAAQVNGFSVAATLDVEDGAF